MAKVSGEGQYSLAIPGSNDVRPFVFLPIPAGHYLMGSLMGLPFAPEAPEHMVALKEFWMADSPVTVEQYEAVMKGNPSRFNVHRDLPVESVTWLDVQQFCKRLSLSAGVSVRLPSEAEWEYACRAGSSTQFHFGNSGSQLSLYAWFENNSRRQTSPVGLKKPNAWGLFDMTGNVWEWCSDLWHEDYIGAPCDGSAWCTAPSGERRRCVRGGAWDMDAFRCRSSYRSYDFEDTGTSRTGFRIVTDTVP